MGVAALILGIVGIIVAVIPMCGIVAFIPCLVGLGLGIADIVVKGKKGQPKGLGIAGTILNALAILFVILWTLCFAAAASDPELAEAFEMEQVEITAE